MRKKSIVLMFLLGQALACLAQDITITTEVAHSNPEFVSVVYENERHVVEGAEIVYRINMPELDSISNVVSCKYSTASETEMMNATYQLEKGVMRIDDVIFKSVSASANKLTFTLNVALRLRGRENDTTLTATTMPIRIYGEPKCIFNSVNYHVLYRGEQASWSVTPAGGTSLWTYEWQLDGVADGSTPTYTLNNSATQTERKTIKAVVICKSPDGQKVWKSFSFPEEYMYVTVFDRPTTVGNITAVQSTTGQLVSKGVSNGCRVQINSVEIKGGDTNGWTYEWTRDGEICSNNQFFSDYLNFTFANNNPQSHTFQYQLKLKNVIQNTIGVEPWEETIPFSLTVYRRPITPLQLIKKGNGRTGTLIATTGLTDEQLKQNEYYLVFGYVDGNGYYHDYNSLRQADLGQTRWSTQIPAEILNASANKVYVYALWKYDDGIEVTSGLCYIDGSKDENWDGSTFDGSTRSVICNDISAIDGTYMPVHSPANKQLFTVNGIMASHKINGLNLVRTSDGLVKKIIIKGRNK